VVIPRGSNPAQGHVGFYIGTDAKGRVILLGGNQGNKVCIAAFAARPLGYMWPKAVNAEVPMPKPRPETLGGSAPVVPVEVPAITKSDAVVVGTGLAGAAQTAQQVNEVATQVTTAKINAQELGILDIISQHPLLIVGVVVVIAAAIIWLVIRRYKKALAEAQQV
jgi:hypothetical protein